MSRSSAAGVRIHHREANTSPAALSYPFESVPGQGEALEVAPGVHWIRMPLPFALDHINLWVLEDGDGWTLVDAGYALDTVKGL